MQGFTSITLSRIASTLALCLELLAGLLGTASAQTLKIGVIAPLTGGAAPWGLAAEQGPKILAAEINAKGGLEVGGKKYPVEIIAYDDQYKAADAIAAYKRLTTRDGVKYVVILSTVASIALRQSVEDDKIVALTSSGAAKTIDPNTRYMFRLLSIAADYMPGFADWVKANVKGRRVLIVNPNDESGWDQNELADKAYRQAGLEVIGRELYERTQKDFSPMLTKIIAMKPDIIDLSAGAPATAGLVIRQARELGYKGVFVKSGGAGPKDIVAGAGKEAAEGVLNIIYADPANKGYQRIVTEYKKTIGQDPNEIIVSFYDGVNVLLRAIQNAGDLNDTAKVVAAFPTALPMQSVQGDTLTFDGKATAGVDRQVMTVNYVGEIKNGEPVIIGKIK
jgi:branched-chain amino acid transport system substrate-binding protein